MHGGCEWVGTSLSFSVFAGEISRQDAKTQSKKKSRNLEKVDFLQISFMLKSLIDRPVSKVLEVLNVSTI